MFNIFFFCRVCLLPDRQTHVQTRIYRVCPSPSYQEKFLFPLDGGPAGKTLLVEVLFAIDFCSRYFYFKYTSKLNITSSKIDKFAF